MGQRRALELRKFIAVASVAKFPLSDFSDKYSRAKDVKQITFKTTTLLAAKTRAKKVFNQLTFFEEIQSWDNETRAIKGKDLRWGSWQKINPYTQKDGKEISGAKCMSDRISSIKIGGTTFVGYINVYCLAKHAE